LGNYDFERIAFYARKRFVQGHGTVTLLEQATTEQEKEEIALVAMLDIEDNLIQDLELCCRHAEECKVTICREKLKKMIEEDLGGPSMLN
jgi:hypothetical protein